MSKRAAYLIFHVLLCGIAGFLGGVFAIRYFAQPSRSIVPDAVVARQFSVIDEDGKVTMELSPRGLDLLGKDGRVQATLRLQYNSKGVLAFSDGKLEARAVFGFLGTDTPSALDDDWGLRIHAPDDNQKGVVFLGTAEGGRSGGLVLRNTMKHSVYAAPPK